MDMEAELRNRLSWARKAAQDYVRCRQVDFDDAYADALIGLWQAIRTHDPERGGLSQWAERKMRSAMLDGVRVRDYATRHQRAAASLHVVVFSTLGATLDHGDRVECSRAIVCHRTERDERRRDLLDDVAEALRPLPFRERALLRRTWIEGASQREAGADFGLTSSRTSQVVAAAFRQLREVES